MEKSPQLVPTKEWQLNKLADFKDFRYYVHSIYGNNETVTDFDEKDFINIIKTETPVYSKLSSIAQCTKIKLLELVSKHLANLELGMNIEENVGMWIFAILSMLDIPLSPSDCYVMREFAKKCLYIRSNLPVHEDKNSSLSLNFFICIVGRFYNQLDLADQ